jgi:hypothetical protein
MGKEFKADHLKSFSGRDLNELTEKESLDIYDSLMEPVTKGELEPIINSSVSRSVFASRGLKILSKLLIKKGILTYEEVDIAQQEVNEENKIYYGIVNRCPHKMPIKTNTNMICNQCKEECPFDEAEKSGVIKSALLLEDTMHGARANHGYIEGMTKYDLDEFKKE